MEDISDIDLMMLICRLSPEKQQELFAKAGIDTRKIPKLPTSENRCTQENNDDECPQEDENFKTFHSHAEHIIKFSIQSLESVVGVRLILECLFGIIGNHQHLKFVSIGSGSAKFESYLHKIVGEAFPNSTCDMICIDPDPKEFEGVEPLIEPKYPTVDEFIASEPIDTIFGMMIWPYPHNSYDVDAIKKLIPRGAVGFLLGFAPCGASGSQDLIDIFLEEGGNGFSYKKFVKIENIEYECVCATTCIFGPGFGFYGKTTSALVYYRKDLHLDEKYTGSYVLNLPPDQRQNCTMS